MFCFCVSTGFSLKGFIRYSELLFPSELLGPLSSRNLLCLLVQESMFKIKMKAV